MSWKEEIKKEDRTKSQLKYLKEFLIDLSKGANPTATARSTAAKYSGLDEDVLMHLIYSK